MKIFISYTMKDNEISIAFLNNIKEKYQNFVNIYIDKLCDLSSQDSVLNELSTSDIVLLLNTQNIFNSKWVKLELDYAKSLGIPIIKYNPSYIINKKPEELLDEINNFKL